MRLRVALTTVVAAAAAMASVPPANAADGVRARRVATLTQPLALAVRAGEPKTVYIASKDGLVRRLKLLRNGGVSVQPTVVLDLSDRIATEGEQGLLGLAFAPDGAKLYAYWSDTGGDNGVYEYPFAAGVADKAAQRTVLPIAHPTNSNHNGGNMAFGPDGLLYVGVGDGGGAGDLPGNAQNRNSLLGKILRINPAQSGGAPYTIPAGNPFVSMSGARPEIWHYGLRNPWRWSFDAVNGDMWIGDVGQQSWEEVDRVAATRAGANFGWNLREGTHPYEGGTPPMDNVEPVYEYGHDSGSCSITGGYVYRGRRIRGLDSAYVFVDYCAGNLLKLVGSTVTGLGVQIPSPTSFGQDAVGELWVLSIEGGVYRLVRKT